MNNIYLPKEKKCINEYGSHLELADVEKAVPIHLVTGYIHSLNKFQFVLVVYFAISQWPHQLYIRCQKDVNEFLSASDQKRYADTLIQRDTFCK